MFQLEVGRRSAALQALQLIKNGDVVGLGSGSTMALAVSEIPGLLRDKTIEASFIATSYQIEQVAITHGLRLTSLNEYPEPDLALDGADQVDDNLNLIKGGGAALTREKIVASASKCFIVIVDEKKIVPILDQPVAIEVIPFAHQAVVSRIKAMGGTAVLRESKGKVGPVITDNGNFVLDADFGQIEDPAKLERSLRFIPGIMEIGLFVDMTDEVYVGKLDGSVEIKRS
ncbi:MAG: ribose 5-phosphate isomerase A [archaeon]